MTTITLQHVSKTFQQQSGSGSVPVAAIHDVSLKIPSGTTLALLGESGSGKSTLLRLIAGLIKPDSGTILFDNVPLEAIELRHRGIGMVFQDGALMPHWEARQTVSFFLWLRKRDYEVPARLERISQITGFGINMLMGRFPRELSGGERQRVAIARALLRDPRVFLFDEPFSNIDAALRAQARLELRRLLNAFPVTSVYVTHDQHEASAFAERVAVMRAGRIVQIGHYAELYANPINRFIAEFIGTPPINLLHGHAERGRWYGPSFSGIPLRHDLPDGAPVLLGIRPQHIHPADDGIAALVEQVTPYLSERFLLLEVCANDERWSITAPLNAEVRQGDVVRCALDENSALFFDPVTEQRIG
jgi:ABC-type sugar transport system ATPase subunit